MTSPEGCRSFARHDWWRNGRAPPSTRLCTRLTQANMTKVVMPCRLALGATELQTLPAAFASPVFRR
ncbi:MAG: hypothetical protein ACK4XK_09975 [Casimicrobiaceae bacterium]